jgi:SEC-C motif
MRRYDPLEAPDPKAWLALDEQARIDLVRDYHRRAGIGLPNDTVHAVLHAVVENQVALGDEIPVERTLQRLMSEGLDRHEAVHAIGSVLAEHVFDISKGAVTDEDPNSKYMARVEQLTAEKWSTYWDEPEEELDDPTTDVFEESGEERPWSPSVPAINPFKTVSRNDPCPCGSGKKFKRCCLDKSYTN